MISKETIDKIFAAAHIEEVVSDFVKLKKRGVNYLGNCPFHNEKTPSFTVSPTKEIYKCFGCGKAGNSVNFIMEHEHISYPEALRYLADKYQIPIEENFKQEDPEEKSERESMYILLSAAQKYFTEQLFESEEGKTIALPYLKERELSANLIELFNLGWAPTGRDTFSNWALNNAFSKELLVKTGLSVESERDGKLYDRFHERIMFPIQNVSGKVVGFGGRILKSNDKAAKYINSPETDVYHKSNILYGLSQAKKAVRQFDQCILVEGYIDVLSMYQNGIENISATSGTSLTDEQLKLIKRFTENVVFLFDGDKAGQKAALRGLDMALQEGLNVHVVTLPEEDDPDTFARKHKDEEIRAYLKDNAKNFVRFRYDLYSEEAEKDPAKKANLVKEIIASVALVTDTIKRSLFLQEAAKVLNMSEEVLYQELRRITIEKTKEQNKGYNVPLTPPPAPTQEEEKIDEETERFQEKYIIKALLLYGKREYPGYTSAAHYICDELSEISWLEPNCLRIFDEMQKALASGELIPDYTNYTHSADVEMEDYVNNLGIEQFVSNLVIEKYRLDDGWKKFLDREIVSPDSNYTLEISHPLKHLKMRKIMQMIYEIDTQWEEAVLPEKQDELLAVKMHLNALKAPLFKELGIVIIAKNSKAKL